MFVSFSFLCFLFVIVLKCSKKCGFVVADKLSVFSLLSSYVGQQGNVCVVADKLSHFCCCLLLSSCVEDDTSPPFCFSLFLCAQGNVCVVADRLSRFCCWCPYVHKEMCG